MHNRSVLLQTRARQLRSALTPSEAALWRLINRCQLGVWFKRQVVLADRFIADFVAPSAKLVVEVDGGYHRTRDIADRRRDRVLARLGYRTLRLDAALVIHNPGEAVRLIRGALA